MEENKKTCFVIMPISDPTGYEAGHFTRVYEHIIKPACVDAGLEVVRGDEVKATNYIALDILRRVLNSDLVVCDLSGRNPNVLYELGIRQAFDLPVVLLKDHKTDRIFDIQGLRTLDYSESLRVDSVAQDKIALKQALLATMNLQSHDINSLVKLLGVEKAAVVERTELSPETSLVLGAIKDVAQRLAVLEMDAAEVPPSVRRVTRSRSKPEFTGLSAPNGAEFAVGDMVSTIVDGRTVQLGNLVGANEQGIILQTKGGQKILLPHDDPRYNNLTDIPF
jgi:hypothetical protein